MSPDERIKELKKQGYISGVMAGKRIKQRLEAFPDISRYDGQKLSQYLMDNAKIYVICEAVTMNQGQTVRWYYNANNLLNWVDIKLINVLKDEEFCCYGRKGSPKRLGYGYIAPYDKESV